jgi:integrase
MKSHSLPQTTTATPATLQDVLDRLAADRGLPKTRSRDLRSAVTSYAKVIGQPCAAIPLDLAAIRGTLDKVAPARVNVSAKRWANMRSDLTAAIAASGLRPMVRTSDVPLDGAWSRLLAQANRRIRLALIRFARWASLRRIDPGAVTDATIEHFVAELDAASLVRNLRYIAGNVAKHWNALIALDGVAKLRPVARGANKRALKRIPRHALPASFRADVERFLHWSSMPDPLDEGARARALRPRSLRLRQEHLHSAASAAVAGGIPVEQLTCLAALVQPDTVRTVLRHLWQQDGRKLSAYTFGIAVTLTAAAVEWVKASPEDIAALKALRKKLGTLPSGLTDKNEAMLATFDDPHLVTALARLPDRLWHAARRAQSQRSFVDLQTALALDILLNAPVRMQNLSAIDFTVHLRWSQGPRRPALITFRRQETKNAVKLEFELPACLSDRLHAYRNEIAPGVLSSKPDALFVTNEGKCRSQAAIAIAINKAVFRHLGVKLTPHQFRHLCAKIILDRYPGAYELVREMLGHTSLKTTVNSYAGINTLRAGRAHAELVNELRESNLGRHRRRRRPHGTTE